MKKLTASILALGSFLSIACEEIPPTITPCQTNRVVLVEEFTGVSCVNCPMGTEKLAQLSDQNPGKIISVGIHAGYFATPSVSNHYTELRCEDGRALESQYLGPVSSYPSACVNRKMFTGEGALSVDMTKWSGYIGSEKCNRPIANLTVSSTYDDQDSMATVTVEMTPSSYFRDALPEDLAVTVMITESNIIGYQLKPTGAEQNYVHNHVLRDIITSDYQGDVLIGKGNVLSLQQKTIADYKIPAEWNPDNCHVVAFIHYKGDGERSVQQAVETHLK
jgi:thiol-disulfide isomerase/thioredoxin